MKVLIFDTETTGLPEGKNPSIMDTCKWPHIVQISYILYDTEKKEIITCKDEIIKIPDTVKISRESENIHGISELQCKRKGILINEALANFNKNLIECDIVIGHNISFDKRLVMVELIRLGKKQYFSNYGKNKKNEFCTMKNTVNLCKIETTNKDGEKYFKYPTLSELHNTLFKTIPKGTHDSMADVLICLRCYIFIVYNYDITKEGCSNIKQLFKYLCT